VPPVAAERKPPAPVAQAAAPEPAAKPAGPARRILGRTGIEVPVVSMGVMNADNPNLVRAALDGGMVLLDTAHGYQDGRNEEMLGTVLPARKRDSFVLCTKVFLSTLDRKTGLFSPETRGEEIEEKLAISLKRLGLDHVDILYLHCQSQRESVLLEPVLRALEKVKKAGLTRFVGVSTHKNEPEVIRAAVEAKLYDVVLTSYNFRQDHHLEVQKAIGEAAAAGLGVVAMKTQAGVYWDKEKSSPINMKAALKWALRDANVHTAIPGFTTLEQLQADLEVLHDPALTPQDNGAWRSRRRWRASSARAASSAFHPVPSTCPSPTSCAATCTATPIATARPPSRSCWRSTCHRRHAATAGPARWFAPRASTCANASATSSGCATCRGNSSSNDGLRSASPAAGALPPRRRRCPKPSDRTYRRNCPASKWFPQVAGWKLSAHRPNTRRTTSSNTSTVGPMLFCNSISKSC
jgi:aryl-alcohol dehydrogenase-like predicted oxidoreductase